MPLTVLIGGARSGKTEVAAGIAEASPAPVTVVATGEARDDEMAERIRRHRLARPSAWGLVEEPLDLEGALSGIPDDACVIVDCLTLWVANLLERGLGDAAVETRGAKAASIAAGRPGLTVAVTNEVGSGIVPANAYARRFRDVHGRVNATWAEAAGTVALVVAGRVLALDPLEVLLRG